MLNILIFGIIVLAVVTAFSKQYQTRTIYFVTKPLTTLLIIVFAFLRSGSADVYENSILAGLVFSLAGDIFLMLDIKKAFLFGLVSFLIAHVFFLNAFIQNVTIFNTSLLVPVAGYSIIMYIALVKKLKSYRYPVLLYLVVITLMLWASLNRYYLYSSTENLLLLAGALLFVISDSVLALNKFRQPIAKGELIILLTYYSAIFLFAYSL